MQQLQYVTHVNSVSKSSQKCFTTEIPTDGGATGTAVPFVFPVPAVPAVPVISGVGGVGGVGAGSRGMAVCEGIGAAAGGAAWGGTASRGSRGSRGSLGSRGVAVSSGMGCSCVSDLRQSAVGSHDVIGFPTVCRSLETAQDVHCMCSVQTLMQEQVNSRAASTDLRADDGSARGAGGSLEPSKVQRFCSFFQNILCHNLVTTFHFYVSLRSRAGSIVLFLSVTFLSMVAWLRSFFMCNQGELNHFCLANVTESVSQKSKSGCRHPTSQPTSLQPKLGAAWMTIQTSQDHHPDKENNSLTQHVALL